MADRTGIVRRDAVVFKLKPDLPKLKKKILVVAPDEFIDVEVLMETLENMVKSKHRYLMVRANT
jgi:hypothetical protein